MKNKPTYNFYPFNHKTEEFDVIIYKNRCVLFKKTDVPKDWWGDYNAPGLQQLMIHGGLTYCQQAEVPNQKKITEKFNKKIKQLYEKEKSGDHKQAMSMLDKKSKLIKDLNSELAKSDEGYVVFGFDCGHYKDKENANLKDPNHVMILTEQMESQLLKFKESYEEYKNAHEAVKGIVRKTIMTNIHREADIQCEMGFGAMLDLLANGEE